MRKFLLTVLVVLLLPASHAEARKRVRHAPAKATAVAAKDTAKTPAIEKAETSAKPAAARTSAKSPAKTGAEGPFDARDPASLIALLGSMDAKATVASREDGGVKLEVATPNFSFGAQYVDCSAAGTGCRGLAFSTSSAEQHATLVQLNAFNQTSITCRVFQDKAGQPHVVYSTILSPSDTREEMRNHLGVWQGCLASFGAFLTDPNGYLAAAP
jgi:hypothetical protein